MNTTTYSTAVASGSSSGIMVVLLTEILSHWHIDLTPEAAAAAVVMLTSIVHYAVMWLPTPPTKDAKP